MQREVRQGLAVTVGYYGSKGTHLRLTRNLNQTFLNAALNPVRPFPTLSPNSPIAPGKPLLNITFREGTGNSNYNALWVTANKRMGKGLQFNASYTFSKSIDYNSQSSQGVTVQDSFNLRGDRGLSDFDVRHRFVISGLYELPFKGNQLKEGWQLSFIEQSQSGNPVTLLAGNVGRNWRRRIPAANANSLTGLATLRPDINGAGHDFTGACGDWNRCAVVSKPRLRSAAGRFMPVRRGRSVAGAVYKWEDHLPFRQHGTKRDDWTKLPQHRLVAD